MRTLIVHTLLLFLGCFAFVRSASGQEAKPCALEGKIWRATNDEPRAIEIEFYKDNVVTLFFMEDEDQEGPIFLWRGKYKETDGSIEAKFESLATGADITEVYQAKIVKKSFRFTAKCRGLKRITSSDRYDLSSYDYMSFIRN